MKTAINYLIFILLGLASYVQAQGPPVLSNPSACQLALPIQDNSCPEDSPIYQPNIFDIQVTDAPGTRLGEDVYLKEVRLIIKHDWLNDLDIVLKSPGGQQVELTSDNGGGENDYGNPNDITCDSAVVFLTNACNSIVDGTPPYLSTALQPEQHFYTFNDSLTNPNGTWQLIICDDVEEDIGTLEFIHLVFEPISCLPIQEISAIDVDSITARVSLIPEGFCGITILEYGPPGFSPGVDSTAGTNGQLTIIDSCPPFTIENLPELSNLDLYVRRYCPISGAFSGNTCGNSFTTGCRPPSVTIETTFADEQNCTTSCGIPCPMTGNWRNAPAADFDWIVHSGPAPTQGTGPESDANGDGKYVYLESSGSSCQIGAEAVLLSACIELNKANSDTCHFSFNYHMFGNSIGQLRLEVTLDGGFNWQSIWNKRGDQGNKWHKEYLSLADFQDGALMQFRFIATKGSGFRGDIALDHLVFYGSILQGYPDQQFYVDNDGDQYGSGTDFILSCLAEAPVGYTNNNLDCNDNDPDINPGRPEIPCDGVDDNCNGFEDDMFLPSPTATNDTICSGEIPEICAAASDGFLTAWYDSPGLENLLSIGPCYTPDLPPNNTPNTVVYTYYAVETNFSCTSAVPSIVEIHVRPQPSLVLNGSSTVCPGDTFNLAALNVFDENFTNGLLSFHADSPATSGNTISNPLIPATNDTAVVAQMVSGEGCSDELVIPLFISPGPDLSFNPTDSFILCKESKTTVNVIAEGGSGDYSYFWDNGKTTSQIEIEAGLASGDENRYAVTVTDINGCLSVDSVIVQTSNNIDSLYRNVVNSISCQGTEGSIALAPLTGLSPYSYQWTSINGVSGSSTSALDTFVIDNLPQGAYNITITDSSSEQCAFLMRNVLVQGPGAVVQAITINPVTCGGAADGEIILDVVGNTPTYNWSNGGTTSVINQLSGGFYSVTINDGTCSTVLSDMEVSEPDTLGFRATMAPTSCAEESDGQISLNLFGGSGTYNLLWSNGETGLLRQGLPSGYYPLTLTDNNVCGLTDSIFVSAPAPLQIQVDSIHQISCFEAADGYLQVSGSGGTPPYRYAWSNGSSIPALFNLTSGTYSLTLTDFNGCQTFQSFELVQPDPLAVVLVNTTAPLCEGVPNGAIEVDATGGTAPYTFQWPEGVLPPSRSNLALGNYAITAVDGNGCISPTLEVPLSPEVVLNPGISTVLPACVGPATGRISLAPDGLAPYTVEWSTGADDLILPDIPTGSYGLSLSDARGCTRDSVIVLDAPQVFNLDLSVDPPSCFGVTDGVVQVLFTETGTPPFNFAWSDGSQAQDRFTLGAGNYQMTVSDALGCNFITDTITLSEPERLRIAAFDIGQINCAGASTAYIEVDIVGGTKPYAINWVGQGVELPGIYEIPRGDYRLQVFDAEDCPIDTTFQIDQPQALTVDVDLLRGGTCDTRQADTLVAVASGGTAPYVYAWSNGDSGPQVLDAAPDDYSLTVTDALGCQDIIRSIKVRPREFGLSIDSFYVKDISCFGAADASMTAKVSGGSGQYSYLFQPARLFENTTEDSITVSGLSLHNQYAVTITDAVTGCRIASEKLKVSEPPPLSIQLVEATPISCFRGTDGALDMNVSGGTFPYNYEWTDGTGQLISTEEDLRNIGSGKYQLLVTDANTCQLSFADSLVESSTNLSLSDTLIIPVACFGEASGGIDITVAGGKAPYNFQWNNGGITEDLFDVPAGLYSLTLTDADTCSTTITDLEVPQNGDLIASETNTTPVSCFGALDGSAEVQINGGVPPYNFDWFRNGQPIANVNKAVLDSVPAGLYRVEFSDSQGCERSFDLEVITPPDIMTNLQVNLPQPPDYNDGGASVVVSGGQPGYTYLWTTGDTTASIAALSAGNYGLTITDSQGCQDSISLTLTDYIDREVINAASVYPNPAKNLVVLELMTSHTLQFQLVVVDALGRPILQQSLPRRDQHKVPIETQDWAAGLYHLGILHQGRLVYSERLVILK